MHRTLRFLVFAVPAVALFATALNGDVYNVTSPPDFGAHVLLRKFYSIVAFAVVGAAYAFARGGRVRTLDAACAVALYSGMIEIGQWFVADELLRWNVIDVGCGAVGGALGGALFTRWSAARAR